MSGDSWRLWTRVAAVVDRGQLAAASIAFPFVSSGTLFD